MACQNHRHFVFEGVILVAPEFKLPRVPLNIITLCLTISCCPRIKILQFCFQIYTECIKPRSWRCQGTATVVWENVTTMYPNTLELSSKPTAKSIQRGFCKPICGHWYYQTALPDKLVRCSYRCYEFILWTYPETWVCLIPRQDWLLKPAAVQMLPSFHLWCTGKLHIDWQTRAKCQVLQILDII